MYSKKAPPLIEWGRILPKISPLPRRTTVLEFKHGIGQKEPFDHLLECGASLFPEVFDGQFAPQHAKVRLSNQSEY